MITPRLARMRRQPAIRLRSPSSFFPVATLAPLFHSVREPLLLIDSRLVLRAVNAAACDLLGRPSRELSGRPWRES